jgi:uncharacterized membrane protein YfcA
MEIDMPPVEKIIALENAPATEKTQEQLIDEINEENQKSYTIRYIIIGLGALLLFAFGLSYYVSTNNVLIYDKGLALFQSIFNYNLLIYLLIGFAAQMVDGALGMAYGATSTSLLSSVGVSQLSASAAVHISEVFTTGASGLSHLHFKNVNKKLFKSLMIPGVIGSITGAYLLSNVLEEVYIKPFVSIYILILGIFVLSKAFKTQRKSKTKNLVPLASFGGFMDAIGGGGWGPIVTSTLLSRGRSLNYTVGSVNLAEFFVAFASGGIFAIFQGVDSWQVIVGLVIGGVFAAPFAAFLVNRIKRKPIMILVGCLIIVLSIINFNKSARKLYQKYNPVETKQ